MPDRRVPLRGVYRGIYGILVDHPDFQALHPPARHTLLTARLCPQNTVASIFRWYPAILQAQTGYTRVTLFRALQELAQTTPPWIEFDDTVLWIRNGLRYDPSIRLADAKHRKAVERAVAGLPPSDIVARFCEYYRIVRPSEAPPKPLPTPSGDLSPPKPIPTTTPRSGTNPRGRHTRREPPRGGSDSDGFARTGSDGGLSLSPDEAKQRMAAVIGQVVSELEGETKP